MSDELEPIDPDTAVQMYLDDRRHNLADATLQAPPIVSSSSRSGVETKTSLISIICRGEISIIFE